MPSQALSLTLLLTLLAGCATTQSAEPAAGEGAAEEADLLADCAQQLSAGGGSLTFECEGFSLQVGRDGQVESGDKTPAQVIQDIVEGMTLMGLAQGSTPLTLPISDAAMASVTPTDAARQKGLSRILLVSGPSPSGPLGVGCVLMQGTPAERCEAALVQVFKRGGPLPDAPETPAEEEPAPRSIDR